MHALLVAELTGFTKWEETSCVPGSRDCAPVSHLFMGSFLGYSMGKDNGDCKLHVRGV